MNAPTHNSLPGEGNDMAEESRHKMACALYERLSAIRQEEGVDPRRYPPVEADIRYDITRTMMGVEAASQRTAELLRPSSLPATLGRFRRIRSILRHPLIAAALVVIAGGAIAKHYESKFGNAQSLQDENLRNLQIQISGIQSECNRLRSLAESQNATNGSILKRLRAAAEASRFEAVGRAVTANGIQAMIGEKHVTLKIPQKLPEKSGQSYILKLESPLTEEGFAAMQDVVEAPMPTFNLHD